MWNHILISPVQNTQSGLHNLMSILQVTWPLFCYIGYFILKECFKFHWYEYQSIQSSGDMASFNRDSRRSLKKVISSGEVLSIILPIYTSDASDVLIPSIRWYSYWSLTAFRIPLNPSTYTTCFIFHSAPKYILYVLHILLSPSTYSICFIFHSAQARCFSKQRSLPTVVLR